jgi:type IV pilus assembly protein PilC
MTVYEYECRDRAGAVVKGLLQANNPEELRSLLRQNGLYLTQFEQRDSKPETGQGGGLMGPKMPKSSEVVVIARQLATLVRCGMPLTQGIEILYEQTQNAVMKEILSEIQAGIVSGDSLSNQFRRYPKVFPELLVSMLEAGEAAGNLDFCLDIAADQLDRMEELKRKVNGAMVYPKIVVAAACITVAIMLLVVVPTFAQVYKDLRAELPTVTQTLINISNAVIKYWWVGLILMGLAYYGYKRYAETPNGKRRLDELSLKLPLVGPIMRKVAIARFVQTLAGSTRAGVPVLRALAVSAGASANSVIKDAVMTAASAVRDGAALGPELEKTNEFPPMVTKMVAAGEASGDLDAMLDEVNKFYERDVEYAVEKMTKMIEPIMTGVVGAIVLFVLLALYMPIFSLGKAFEKSGK